MASAQGSHIEVTSPVPRELWWELARRDRDVLVTQTPTWLDCLCDAWPLEDVSRHYRFASGAELVVPMVRRRSWPGRLLTEESWPGWGVGGAVVPDGAPDVDQARLVFDDLASRPALRVAVRFSPRGPSVWDASVPEGFASVERTTYLLDLAGGFEEAWTRGFHSSVRQGARRAERSQATFEVDRTGRFVPQFQQLYEESLVRWAEQQHEPLALARWRRLREEPPRLVAAVAERFGADCAIWLASHEGRPAAAIVVLRHGTHAKYWRGAMDRSLAAPVHANHMLHRLAIQDACAAGCLLYDMGDARPGSTLARFKESFGARPVFSPAYYRERLPLTAADRYLREAVKRLIGFRNA
ncbi:GNAT family N-acetyltransferase [Streptacidiphilus fuscans]|uniref:GNAT family N-acetyltransferase n=1 Tax=Streptacidiphilus fuscans TaxID=2789292 RepID=A0A931FCJ8_9ACTN|nr:GNAT family N-acetyltransferase [Streptacidiphilus fuscans]MBF9066531.1 GNAT family N-acetyltransferase [Streptacidiphilus fuscans]